MSTHGVLSTAAVQTASHVDPAWGFAVPVGLALLFVLPAILLARRQARQDLEPEQAQAQDLGLASVQVQAHGPRFGVQFVSPVSGDVVAEYLGQSLGQVRSLSLNRPAVAVLTGAHLVILPTATATLHLEA